MDTTIHKFGRASLKGVSNISLGIPGVMADAGRRISFWIYLSVLPTGTGETIVRVLTSGGTTCYVLQITSGGVLQLRSTFDGTQLGSNGSTLAAATWYRIALAQVLTSTSNYTIKTYLNGGASPDISITGASGNLNSVSSADLTIGIGQSHGVTAYYQHVFVDNGTDGLDPAGAGNHLYLTAKLPTGNGANNQYTANGSASGTGTGNARYINTRPYTTADFLNQTSGGSLDEDFAIQANSAGDDDISSGCTIIAHRAWQIARLTGSGATPTVSHFDNAVVTAFTPNATFTTATTHDTVSATYPSTQPICGQRSTKGSGKVPAFCAAGVIIAYTKAAGTQFTSTQSCTQATTATATRANNLTRSAIQATTATKVSALALVRSATQAASAVNVRLANLLRSATASATATQTPIRNIGNTQSTAQGSTASLIQSPNLSRSATQATTATSSRVIAAARSAIQAVTATAARAIALIRSTTQSATATETAIKSVTSTQSATQATAATETASIAATRSATQASSASASRTMNTMRSATQATVATMARALAALRAAVQASTASLRQSVGLSRTGTQGSTTSSSRTISASASAAQSSSATTSRAETASRMATQASTASQSHAIGLARSASQGATAFLRSVIHVIRSATSGSDATVTRSSSGIDSTQSATQGSSATARAAVGSRQSASQGSASTLSKIIGVGRMAAQATQATSSRVVSIARSATQATIAIWRRGFPFAPGSIRTMLRSISRLRQFLSLLRPRTAPPNAQERLIIAAGMRPRRIQSQQLRRGLRAVEKDES